MLQPRLEVFGASFNNRTLFEVAAASASNILRTVGRDLLEPAQPLSIGDLRPMCSLTELRVVGRRQGRYFFGDG